MNRYEIERLLAENPSGVKFIDNKDGWIKVIYSHKDRVSYVTCFDELSSMGIEILRDYYTLEEKE